MKTSAKRTTLHLSASEIKSAKILMKEMGISKKELKVISNLYGVSFAKVVEIMEHGKYKQRLRS